MRAIEAEALAAEAARLRPQQLLAACFTRRGHGPSDALLAAVEALPPELAARVEACRIDVDGDAATLDELRVFKVPELLLLAADGHIVERSEGELRAEQVAELVAYVLDAMMAAD